MKEFLKAVKSGEKKAIALLGMVMSIVLAICVAIFQAWKNEKIKKANFQHALNEGKEFVEICNTIINQLPAEQGRLRNELKEVRDLTYNYVAGQYPVDPYRIKRVGRWAIRLKAHQDDPAHLYGVINQILVTV